MSAPASLLDYLSLALSTLPGQHDFAVQVVRSQPRRSHALFPHASNLKTKIWQEEVLVVVKERGPGGEEPRPARVPVAALEANVYTIPATGTSLVYVAKVDTSGLGSSSPSPTRTLVAAFVEHTLLHPPHATRRVRVHVFARAQGQYLFPGSVENTEKRVLDDKGLIRWWKGALALAAKHVPPTPTPVQLFYVIPGLSHAESLPYVPEAPTATPAWTYGHPYATVSSPLHPASAPPAPLTDHMPNFPDDPKARFITSLTSSAVASAGAPDDYDELVTALSVRTLNAGGASASALESLNLERARERTRFLNGCEGGVDEWWERMAFRQECCSGTLVAFFVVVRDGEAAEAPSVAPKPETAAVGHAIFTKLWSQFHNVDYARPAIDKCRAAADKWEHDVELVVRSEGHDPAANPAALPEDADELVRKRASYGKEVWREVRVHNAALETKKRELPEPAKVNMMVPRKKVKK